MSRIWVKVMKRQKIQRDKAVPCTRDEIDECLHDVCKDFDIPSPMWLSKQRDEFEQFGITDFSGDNFFEPITFDKLVVQYLPDDGVTRKSKDPRNDFSY